MATPTIITTPGASDANSYADIADADSYFDTHLYRDNWIGSYEDEQTRALLLATRLLDTEINWPGGKVTSTQALRFPRVGLIDPDGFDVPYTLIPQFLINATAELAGYLIGSNRTAESDTLGFSRIKIDTLELVVDKRDRANVIPDSVVNLIRPYGAYIQSKQPPRVYRT